MSLSAHYRCFIFCLISIFCLGGCAGKKKLLTQLDEKIGRYDQPAVCGTIGELTFVDERGSITQGELKIPKLSTPNQNTVYYPPLTEPLKDEIRNLFLSYVGGEGPAHTFTVTINEAVMKFEAGLMKEKEQATWSVAIRSETDRFESRASSEAEYFAESADASEGYLTKLNDKTMRIALLRSLAAIGRQMEDLDACGSGSEG